MDEEEEDGDWDTNGWYTDDEDITDELLMTYEEQPDYLPFFLDMMSQRKIDGSHYEMCGCGCFYGWRTRLDIDQAQQLARRIRKKITGVSSVYTPIERLLDDVRPGETPETSEELERLQRLICAVLSSPISSSS